MPQLTQELYDALNKRGSRGRGRGRVDEESPTDRLCREARYCGLPTPVTEHRFDPSGYRKWRFDLAWPDYKIAVEIEGLVYSNKGDNRLTGRHVSVTGFEKDIEKYGYAFAWGWRVLRVRSTDVRSGAALNWLMDAFKLVQR